MLNANVMAISTGWSCNKMLACTSSCKPKSRARYTITNATTKAIRLIMTASTNKLALSLAAVAPNTFWVLMLRMRIGVSASVKFMKFAAAITTISSEKQISR